MFCSVFCSPPGPAAPRPHPHTDLTDAAITTGTTQDSVAPKPQRNHHRSGANLQDIGSVVAVSGEATTCSAIVSTGATACRTVASGKTASNTISAALLPPGDATLPSTGQLLVLQSQQQPVYYTITPTPVLQPLLYAVQTPPSVLLPGAPPLDLQGMTILNQTSGSVEHIANAGRNTAAIWSVNQPKVLGGVRGVMAPSRLDAAVEEVGGRISQVVHDGWGGVDPNTGPKHPSGVFNQRPGPVVFTHSRNAKRGLDVQQ